VTGEPLDHPAPQQFKVHRFPQGFLWGASTSSHQVEGGNRWNDWWEHEQSGRLPHVSGDACRHYERFEQDFDLARSWGHNAHRFSIEWSRVEPSEGRWNTEALQHYREVIRALRKRGLEPVVTLHHFTNPAWFAERGGWSRNDSAGLFARYSEISEPTSPTGSPSTNRQSM
jgi:beta-glucosidase